MEKLRLPVRYEIHPHQDDRYTKIRIYVMHDGVNYNNSFFSKEAMDNARDSIVDIPILAFIKVDDGTDHQDFGGHEMSLVIDSNGARLKYLGRPIGVIPETGNNYHYEEWEGRTYVVVDGYIWNDYANEALDILKRDGVKGQSMEIRIDDYVEGSDPVEITKYRYTGLTLLGDDHIPAMEGAKAELIGNFTKNEVFSKRVNELNESLKNGSSKVQKGGIGMNDIQKLLKKFGYTKETIESRGINFEDISAEELEVKLEIFSRDDQIEKLQADLEVANKKAEEFEAKIGKIQAEFDAMKEKYAALEAEAKELREYREEQERAKHEAACLQILAKPEFSKLEEEDIAELKEKMHMYSVQEFEDKLYVIYGRKMAQLKDNADESKRNLTFTIGFDNLGQSKDNEPAWKILFDKYGK